MVEALPNLLLDFVPALATGICDVAVATFAASIRPWRYVCSSKYRARIHAELSGRPALARYWYMAWGSFAVVASAILMGAVLLLLTSAQRPGHSAVSQAMHSEAGRAVGKVAGWLRR